MNPRCALAQAAAWRDEGEDIEVLELAIDEAMAMIADGRIVYAKSIILLQYLVLNIFP